MGFPRQEHWSRWPFPPPGRSSESRDRTHISCIGRLILYYWDMREALRWDYIEQNVSGLSSVSFDKHIYLCDHHPSQHKDHFHHPRKFPLAPPQSAPCPCPALWQSITDLLPATVISYSCIFSSFSYKWKFIVCISFLLAFLCVSAFQVNHWSTRI